MYLAQTPHYVCVAVVWYRLVYKMSIAPVSLMYCVVAVSGRKLAYRAMEKVCDCVCNGEMGRGAS